ncbi:hypothetical protein HBI56_061390 [Parastagonospora nodorum]|nr:hypothetical protein HBH53_124700 [Parastagonospora nodorum]KAH3973696.1 hypothetical protein HBH51_097930 [Parastagonospora nodorum]KAH4002562.1 hypothetical protein HBI10_074240 [Parastagonospora nodorum]KAH4017926.1 hypothetical protein HBI13_136890 [Parastagonospora nodorum]KAH4036163.1 hypothetical protein HBI09_083500 [Parastagonospora nodorum]
MYHRSYSVRLIPASIVLQTNADIGTLPVPQSKQKIAQSTRWDISLRLSEGLFGLTDDDSPFPGTWRSPGIIPLSCRCEPRPRMLRMRISATIAIDAIDALHSQRDPFASLFMR